MADLHEVLSSAYDEMSSETTSATPEPVPAVETTTEVPAPQDGAPQPATTSERVRDERGRFAPKTDEKPPDTAKAIAKPAPTPEEKGKGDGASATPTAPPPSPEPAKPAAETIKPPSSWKPSAREKWAALPREVQEEAVRIDREVRATMQRAAEVEKRASEFTQAIAPYEAMFRSQGVSSTQAIANLAGTYYQLTHGAPQQKAQILASVIKTSGVPIELLASALDGQPAAPTIDPATIAQQTEARIMQRLQAEAARRQSEAAQVRLQKFEAAHEFFADVRETMADILAARRQSNPSDSDLEAVYDLACRAHPEISGVLKQREAAKAAETAKAATQRAQAAASSVKTSPAGAAPSGQPKGLRSILEHRAGELERQGLL